MLIWMCALHCEAKPVIDFYRLKKSTPKSDFDLYSYKDMSCIVSGTGSRNMASAINWAYRLYSQQKDLIFINIGIAGHKNLDVGTAVLISQASAANKPECIAIDTQISHRFESGPIISLTEENTDYDEQALYDMEAFAFLQTAAKLTELDQCQVIKVISDNRQISPSRNKARISQLIADNMTSIADFAQHLQHNISA